MKNSINDSDEKVTEIKPLELMHIDSHQENIIDEEMPDDVLQFIRQEANKKLKIGAIFIGFGLVVTIGSYLLRANVYIVCWGMILTGVFYLWRGFAEYK